MTHHCLPAALLVVVVARLTRAASMGTDRRWRPMVGSLDGGEVLQEARRWPAASSWLEQER